MTGSIPPSEESLRQAVGAILRGEVVAYPTETLYGLAADATSSAAVERVFALKRRPPDKPAPIIAAGVDMVKEFVVSIPPGAYRLIERFWPGPLTLIFDAGPAIPRILTAGTGTVGLRVSSGEIARKLLLMAKKPLTATSANLSGAGDPSDPETIRRDLGDGLSLIIDVGRLKPGPGSTVVDPRGKKILILREGAIPADQIIAAWNKG